MHKQHDGLKSKMSINVLATCMYRNGVVGLALTEFGSVAMFFIVREQCAVGVSSIRKVFLTRLSERDRVQKE